LRVELGRVSFEGVGQGTSFGEAARGVDVFLLPDEVLQMVYSSHVISFPAYPTALSGQNSRRAGNLRLNSLDPLSVDIGVDSFLFLHTCLSGFGNLTHPVDHLRRRLQFLFLPDAVSCPPQVVVFEYLLAVDRRERVSEVHDGASFR
jgi:hypothetical protein